MKFSILINNYNYADYLCEAIESALEQTHPAHEIIFVDDGSRDHSLAMVREHFGGHPRLQVIFKPNGGQLSAIAAGIRAASGERLCLLDSDDCYKPNYLEELAKLHKRQPGLEQVFCSYEIFGRTASPFHSLIRLLRNWTRTRRKSDYDYGRSAVWNYLTAKEKGCFFLGGFTSRISLPLDLARRLDLERLDKAISLRTSADYALNFGVSLLGGKKYYFNQKLIEYRLHENNNWARVKQTPAQRLEHQAFGDTVRAFYSKNLDREEDIFRLMDEEIASIPAPRSAHLRAYERLRRRTYRHNGRWEVRSSFWKRLKEYICLF